MTKNQAKGYLYEILIAHLMEQNGFARCQKNDQINKIYKCGVVTEKGEIRGRGTKHQIDFVGIFLKSVPFTYPLRALVECKFWTEKKKYKPVSKAFIREYIGVHKDISENYISGSTTTSRFQDIPIIFSAGGFDSEAEKLAWAQGISLVSHSRLPILKDVLDFINLLIDNVPTNFYNNTGNFEELKSITRAVLKREPVDYNQLRQRVFDIILRRIRRNSTPVFDTVDRLVEIIDNLRDKQYRTFIFATTDNAKLINLIGYEAFPDELFADSNEQDCMVFFGESDEAGDTLLDIQRVFYITLNHDDQRREFYFQASDAMMRENFSNLSFEARINEKMQYFRRLSIIREINGLTRIINLNVNFEEIGSDNSLRQRVDIV